MLAAIAGGGTAVGGGGRGVARRSQATATNREWAEDAAGRLGRPGALRRRFRRVGAARYPEGPGGTVALTAVVRGVLWAGLA